MIVLREIKCYVDIYGRDITAAECEKTGRIFVCIDELKYSGFRLYPKEQYSKLFIQPRQFNKEFQMFMLLQAQNYMLDNKIGFTENEIIQCISNCMMFFTNSKVSSPVNNGFSNSDHSVKRESIEFLPMTKQNVNKHNGNEQPENTKFAKKSFDAASNHSSQYKEQNKPSMTTKHNVNKHIQRDLPEKASIDAANNLSPQFKEHNKSPTIGESKRSSSFSQSFNSLNSFGEEAKNSSFGKLRMPHTQTPENGEKVYEKLEAIKLKNPQHQVLVTFIDRKNSYWVQDMANADVLLELDNKIRDEVATQSFTKTRVFNKIYLAPYEDSWFRSKIVKFKPLTMFFVDYGNCEQVTTLKEASEELSKIPGQAVKIIDMKNSANLFDTVTIKVKEERANGSYLVDIIGEENIPAAPKQSPTVFFSKPKPLCDLERGQRVMIVSELDGKLGLRTKECYAELKQIEKAIEAFTLTPVEEADKGQLVLCKNNGKVSRAVISNIKGDSVEVELLDFYEKAQVQLSSIYHISEPLAEEPTTFILTPLVKGFSSDSRHIIKELITTRAKSTVVLNGIHFDLQLDSGLLSEKLRPKKKNKNVVMLEDMKKFKPELGRGEYMVQTSTDSEHVTISHMEAIQDHLDVILKSEMEDQQPYTPALGEVCFGLYEDSWFRCVVQRIADGRFQVKFIDFGNAELLDRENLRKLTADARAAPVLGVLCQIVGLPKTDNVDVALSSLTTKGDSLEVDVKGFNGQFYEIEIPLLTQIVKGV